MAEGNAPSCAVMLPTHNRVDDLARTLRMLGALDPAPLEILVTADGCTDGTADLLRGRGTPYRVLVNERGAGSIASRDRMLRTTGAEVVLSLDDDSYPLERDAIRRLQTLFAARPRLAVADFPQRSDEYPETLTSTKFPPPAYVGSYSSASAALRVSAYRELGGYPTFFHHAYEEPDFALRCVSAGWEVRREEALTIRHHYTQVQRNEVRTHHFHARNELWSVGLRCPGAWRWAVAAFRAVRQAGYAAKRGPGWLVREPQWWLAAWRGRAEVAAARAPLPWPRYLAWMRLMRREIQAPEAWAAAFSDSTCAPQKSGDAGGAPAS